MTTIKKFFVKWLELLSSAKMVMFWFPFAVSTYFMHYLMTTLCEISVKLLTLHPEAYSVANLILQCATTTFISWCTFTVSLGGGIIVCREKFKVEKLNAMTTKPEHKEAIDNIGI